MDSDLEDKQLSNSNVEILDGQIDPNLVVMF